MSHSPSLPSPKTSPWHDRRGLFCGYVRRFKDPFIQEFLARQRASSMELIGASMALGVLLFVACSVRDVYQATTYQWGLTVALAWRVVVMSILAWMVLAVKRTPQHSQILSCGFVFLLLLGLSASSALSQSHLSNLIFPVVFICLMAAAMWLEGPGLLFSLGAGLAVVFGLIVFPLDPSTREYITGPVVVSYAVYVGLALFLGARLRKARLTSTFDTFVLEQNLSRMALADPLTGLFNRAGWLVQVEQWLDKMQNHEPAAILYLDLDHFKSVNDKMGHPEGDRILVLAAALARSALRAQDVLGRFGGEEFVAFLPNTSLPQAQEVAERLRRAIEEEGARQPMPLTVSVGVSVFADKSRIQEALRQADMALLGAKRAGRNRIQVFAEGGLG